jgi:hypothetical protein
LYKSTASYELTPTATGTWKNKEKLNFITMIYFDV